MVDEHFDRHYQEARGGLNGAIVEIGHRVTRALADVFVVLNRIEYSAPWNAQRERARSH